MEELEELELEGAYLGVRLRGHSSWEGDTTPPK